MTQKFTPRSLRIRALSLLLLLTLPIAGCSGFGTKDAKFAWKMPWSKKTDQQEPYPNPVRLVVTWAPDTLVQTGRTPTRGFGGRLFFYNEKTHAVPVEGELTVHAIAENADGSTGEVKRYHFTAEQFTEHFSQSDIGASYSIWIPWDAVGGDQTRISLVPSFRSTSGKLVQGELAVVGLPGRRSAAEQLAKRPPTATELLAQRAKPSMGLTTTTIPVRGSHGVPPASSQPLIPALADATSRGFSSAGVSAGASPESMTSPGFTSNPVSIEPTTVDSPSPSLITTRPESAPWVSDRSRGGLKPARIGAGRNVQAGEPSVRQVSAESIR